MDLMNAIACRRELGAQLRTLRIASGLAGREAAQLLNWSTSKISRLETGHRSASPEDIRRLLTLYAVPDQDKSPLLELARQTRQPGWSRSAFDSLQYSRFLGMESAAARTRCFAQGSIPGLLQTEAYARAMLQALPPPWATLIGAEEIERRVKARLHRQRRIVRADGPELHFILDEAVLHRQVGGAAVLREQLQHLITTTTHLNGTLQVLPYTADCGALYSTFFIIEFDNTKASDAVYLEGLSTSLSLEKEEDLHLYRQAFRSLQSNALNPSDSIRHITQVLHDL